MNNLESNIVLFGVTLCFSSSYLFIKNLTNDLSSYAYLTLSVGIATIILFVLFYKKIKDINLKILWKSFILASLTFGNLLFEEKGLHNLDASVASFIASLNIVFVPMILLLWKKKPSRNQIIGIIFIIIGLLFTNKLSIIGFLNISVFFMVISSIFMAVYIVVTNYYTKEEDPILLCMGQMFFTAFIAFILWFLQEKRTFFSIKYTKEMLANLFLIAFFVKAYAYLMLMYAQKYANPINVTIIAAMEPIVTMILALSISNLYGNTETINLEKVIGAFLITIGAICAGTNFLRKKEKNERTNSSFLFKKR